jgi:hypothetical protein
MYPMVVSGTVMLILEEHNMKKIIAKYQVYLIIGGLLVVFGILLLWPQKNGNEKVETGSENKTKIVGIMQRSDSVDWGKTEIELPEKSHLLKSKTSFINGDKTVKLLAILGMSDAKVIQSDENYVIYRNDNSSLYIKLKEKQIDYQIRSKLAYKGDRNTNTAKNNLAELLSKISTQKVGVMEVEYYKDEFRAIRTSLASADFMEIRTNFLYDDTPVLSYQGGPTIKAQYNFEGKLGRLIIFNPFDELENDSEITLVKVDEIKNMDPKNFPIFNIVGNRDFELSTREEMVGMIKSENSRLSYIYDSSKEKYIPYLVVKGKTNLSSGISEVVFGVPIIK